MSNTTANGQIDRYLARLRAALEDVWPPRRDEILADVEEHIAAALEEVTDPTELDVKKILERIGEPGLIAATALSLEPSGAAAAPPVPKRHVHEASAVAFLTAGFLIPVIGWIVGVVLLWTSNVWKLHDKLIGTFLVPFGLLPGFYLLFLRPETVDSAASSCSVAIGPSVPQTTFCSSTQSVTASRLSPVHLTVLFVVLIVIPVLTAAYLIVMTRIRSRRTYAAALGNFNLAS